MRDVLRKRTLREKYDKYQNFPTRFGLLLSLECSGEISRKSVESAYPINSLKVNVFLLKSYARFSLVKFRSQLAPRLEIITPDKMQFLTVERANKAEIYISTARGQKGLGTISVRHDGYHAAKKVLVRQVVGHCRPASVALTFVFFLYRYCYCYCFLTRKPFKPRRVCGIALARGIRFQSLFPTEVFWFFVSSGVTGYRVIV